MTEIHPGRHPNFDITKFDPPQQRVLRRMEQMFHLNRDGELTLGATSHYRYALVRPTNFVQSLLHTDREIMVIFSQYTDFQSRSLDAFDRLLEILDEFRVEKIVRILVSDDTNVVEKIENLFKSKPDSPVVIPFHVSEFNLSTKDEQIFSRFRNFTFSRDLFSMSSPLRSDLYFYGRSPLINEICAKLSVGENFGLFGLRRSGKTSIVHGVQRAIKRRAGCGIVLDCSSPSIHQLRWNELLYYISHQIKIQNSISIKLNENKYDKTKAADTFLKDISQMKRHAKVDFFALLFDEIERISYGTASSRHWNDDRDFLLFWQSIRYGFQSSSSPYTFLIVGTNPSAIEHVKIFESDNPLFGNVEKRFIPMFDSSLVEEMVEDIGSIMGIEFDSFSKNQLYVDFGGHPFLTRYACSFVAQTAARRPIKIDRTIYHDGIQRYEVEASNYVASVVDMLKEMYPDEYEMLKYLSIRDHDSFHELAASDPNLVEHILGYGIVDRGEKSYYFNIGIVNQYFENEARPINLLDGRARRTELNSRRNDLEQIIRTKIFQVFEISFAASLRTSKLLHALSESRRGDLMSVPFEKLLRAGESPLYFNELKQIVMKEWEKFQNVISIPKSEFDYHMDVINRSRADAHAKDISDDDFETARVSLRTLEKLFH